MAQARTGIDFCYLCGRPLRTPRDGDRADITAEHVIPQSLYGETPRRSQDQWRIILDVHGPCDVKYKRDFDSAISLLCRIVTSPAEHWPKPGRVRSLDLSPALRPDDSGSPAPAIIGDDRFVAAAWNWIRGIHAALYGSFLPRDVPQCVLPPVPYCSDLDSGAPSLEEAAEHSKTVRACVQACTANDRWDGFSCWGGKMEYRCVWLDLSKEGDPEISGVCFWTLRFDLSDEWSRTVFTDRPPLPWHGSYHMKYCPVNATTVTHQEVQGFCKLLGSLAF